MRGFVICAGLLAAACNERTVDQGQQVEIISVRSDLAGLRAEVEQMKNEIKRQRDFTSKVLDYTVSVDKSGSSLRSTMNRNVQIANEQAAKDMTAAGACGKASVQATDGQWFQTNKTCTVNDLKKPN